MIYSVLFGECCADSVDAFAVEGVFGRVERQRNVLGVLVNGVHLEYVVGRRENHLVAFSQYHRLQYVDYLRDVAHAEAVCIFVENVECGACQECVAEGVLLIEVSGDSAWLLVGPDAPFVHVEFYTLLVFGYDV